MEIICSASLIRTAANDDATEIDASKVGADVQEIARGIGLDNRIDAKFLHAGPGFGGPAFPRMRSP
jgi:UDP-glucose 6-dehydrogenase